jgi:predicted nucleotidyltransferase
MNQRERAAWEMHCFFDHLGVEYVIIGGLAVQHWGEPRFTQDVDLTVTTLPIGLTEFIQKIVDRFPSRIEDPITFARHNRIVLVRASNGCPVDISLALPGYEDELMRRAVDYELEPEKVVNLCSAEDLIIHKAVAGRPQDVRDIEGIVYRQREALDVDYLRRWLRDFADVLATPEILELFERPWRKIHSL